MSTRYRATRRAVATKGVGFVPGPVVMQLAQIDLGRGRQELFRNQLPALLTELANRTRILRITASSALEGVPGQRQ